MDMPQPTLAVSVSGSGGSGAVTVGLILLQSMANAGFYGVMTRSFGPQIRGGESAVMIHFSDHPIEVTAETSDIHLALDWKNFERFADEIPLTENSIVLFDSSREKPPGLVENSGAQLIGLALQDEVKKLKDSRINMFGLGVLAKQIGLETDTVELALQKILGKKGDEVVQSSMQAVKVGMSLYETEYNPIENWMANTAPRWNISGNEACGLGVLRGGLKIAAAYPITPATDIVEYLAPRIDQTGGAVLIAEDELAAINMVIGASFGGKPAMTATSGPGFALMTESMGLAVASETPALVVTVMRVGPSTGIPTKSEQTDLNQVLFGFHGETPHVVVAPLNVRDTVTTSQWALGLAEALQTLVVEATDQRLGQARVVTDPVESVDLGLSRKLMQDDTDTPYQRYILNDDHISPMSIPGMPDNFYTADGLEHTQQGVPSSMASDHEAQLQKRREKIEGFAYGDLWASLQSEKNSKALIITWGSSYEACRTATQNLRNRGIHIDLVGLRLLMPLQTQILQTLCKRKTVIVVEQSESGQFYHYLLGRNAIPKSALKLAEPGPVLLKPSEIEAFVEGAIK